MLLIELAKSIHQTPAVEQIRGDLLTTVRSVHHLPSTATPLLQSAQMQLPWPSPEQNPLVVFAVGDYRNRLLATAHALLHQLQLWWEVTHTNPSIQNLLRIPTDNLQATRGTSQHPTANVTSTSLPATLPSAQPRDDVVFQQELQQLIASQQSQQGLAGNAAGGTPASSPARARARASTDAPRNRRKATAPKRSKLKTPPKGRAGQVATPTPPSSVRAPMSTDVVPATQPWEAAAAALLDSTTTNPPHDERGNAVADDSSLRRSIRLCVRSIKVCARAAGASNPAAPLDASEQHAGAEQLSAEQSFPATQAANAAAVPSGAANAAANAAAAPSGAANAAAAPTAPARPFVLRQKQKRPCPPLSAEGEPGPSEKAPRAPSPQPAPAPQLRRASPEPAPQPAANPRLLPLEFQVVPRRQHPAAMSSEGLLRPSEGILKSHEAHESEQAASTPEVPVPVEVAVVSCSGDTPEVAPAAAPHAEADTPHATEGAAADTTGTSSLRTVTISSVILRQLGTEGLVQLPRVVPRRFKKSNQHANAILRYVVCAWICHKYAITMHGNRDLVKAKARASAEPA